MGQIKNIKLHIVTDIKKKSLLSHILQYNHQHQRICQLSVHDPFSKLHATSTKLYEAFPLNHQVVVRTVSQLYWDRLQLFLLERPQQRTCTKHPMETPSCRLFMHRLPSHHQPTWNEPSS